MALIKRSLSNRTKTLTSGILIFVLIIVLLLLKFLYPTSSRTSSTKEEPQYRFDKLVEKQSSSLNDSLPHYQYKRLQDSIRRLLSAENFPSSGNSMGSFDISIEKSEFGKNNVKYYLGISGYFEKGFFEFYSLHGKNYIEYSTFRNQEVNGVRSGEIKTVKTDLEVEQLTQSDWRISYPLSKTRYIIWQAVIVLLMFVSAGLFFYGLIGLPLRILFLVAKGKAFSEEVIARFHVIATILLCVGLFQSILRITLHLLYKSQIPYPMTFYYYDDIMSGVWFVIGGLIVLLFAKAFKSGQELQEEQALTV